MPKTEIRARSVVQAFLPVLGTIVIFAAVLFVEALVAQIAVVLLGILLIQAGVWKLAEPLLPEARINLELRHEVDRFLAIVRGLDSAADEPGQDADPADARNPEQIRSAMLASVDRILVITGRFEPLDEPSEATPANE